MKKISVIIPVYNEAEQIRENLTEIIQKSSETGETRYCFEYLVIDDGSTDNTLELVVDLGLENVRCISFTRNFGKEAAILAGLNHAEGDAAIVMDCDLQHPPSKIPEMITKWEQGSLVVNGCKSDRGDESFIYKMCSKIFYGTFLKLTKIDIVGHSDFKLLDQQVVSEYVDLTEKGRFFRAGIADMGFRSANIYFDVEPRAGGQSTWTFRKLLSYAIDGIANFTSIPLHLVSFIALIVFFVSVVLSLITLVQFMMGIAVEGFTTVIILELAIGSCIMFSLGQIGIYLEKIFNEVKGRPSYIIDGSRSFRGYSKSKK